MLNGLSNPAEMSKHIFSVSTEASLASMTATHNYLCWPIAISCLTEEKVIKYFLGISHRVNQHSEEEYISRGQATAPIVATHSILKEYLAGIFQRDSCANCLHCPHCKPLKFPCSGLTSNYVLRICETGAGGQVDYLEWELFLSLCSSLTRGDNLDAFGLPCSDGQLLTILNFGNIIKSPWSTYSPTP